MTHPRDILLDGTRGGWSLPVCDHYSGVEARMRKSLALQASLRGARGACLFDVTLDCEDGAAVGAERAHAELVVDLLQGAEPQARVAVRVHPVDHPAFAQDVALIVGRAGHRLAHVMVPKVESAQDIDRAAAAVDGAGHPGLPLHVLVESPGAVSRLGEIAGHARVQSVSFGLMDFVSAHAGAIPDEAMGVAGQFAHPLVLRAKLEIAAACHAAGKVPSHCVVTEFKDRAALAAAARRAARELGYTRMWSIHPDQIEPIVQAFTPASDEVALAADIIAHAARADWAPLAMAGRLHDRASYRYYWQVLQRAHRTGSALPAAVASYFAQA